MFLRFLFPILLLSISLKGEAKIVFKDMREHAEQFLQRLKSNPRNTDPYYPYHRVSLTVSADDCDYIPKVPDAGKIFEENGIRYQLMHNGVKVLEGCFFNFALSTHIIYALRGHCEPQQEKAFYEVLKYIPENATMIEVGSYWAYYSLWFANDIKGAKNYLIEPLFKHMEVGLKNFALNGRGANFFLGYIQVTPEDSRRFLGANRVVLDDFIVDNQIEHVNILHADVPAADFELLKSCRKSIEQGKIDYFFISTHDPILHFNSRNYLLDCNFDIIAEHKVEGSCSINGLIVARRKGAKGPDHIPVRSY